MRLTVLQWLCLGSCWQNSGKGCTGSNCFHAHVIVCDCGSLLWINQILSACAAHILKILQQSSVEGCSCQLFHPYLTDVTSHTVRKKKCLLSKYNWVFILMLQYTGLGWVLAKTIIHNSFSLWQITNDKCHCLPIQVVYSDTLLALI